MLAVKGFGQSVRRRRIVQIERRVNRVQNLLWLGRLEDEVRDSASLGELSRFAFQVGRGVENHACLSQRCVGPELADKLEAIHRRHLNIGNDEIGMLDAGFCQSF